MRLAMQTSSKVVLFDLDGTLVDTAPEIADAVNDLLKELGKPTVPDSLVVQWIGEGARTLLRHALEHANVPVGELPALWSRFERHYGERCGQRSTPYPGIHAALERLRDAGDTLAVVTNKEGVYAKLLLDRHDLASFFSTLVAGDTLAVKKPDAAVVRYALEKLGATLDAALMIGDSVVDVRTARAAGIPVWAVRHGYHHGGFLGADRPDRFITHFDELGTTLVP
jgi:phosphoglycolate phosphatase